MRYRRVSIYGGPSSGKSFLGLALTPAIMKAGIPVEFVDEAIKLMAWRKELPFSSYHSALIILDQIHREESVTRNSGIAVSTGPPLQQCVYMYMRQEPIAEQVLAMAMQYEKDYPALNIFMCRDDTMFRTEGRYQAKLAEAKAIDVALDALLDRTELSFMAHTQGCDETHLVADVLTALQKE